MQKIIKLEDFKNKSLDEIIELYRSGYVLEGINKPSIQKLQLPSIGTSLAVIFAGALSGLLLTLLLRQLPKISCPTKIKTS